jgi:hypothetical protein
LLPEPVKPEIDETLITTPSPLSFINGAKARIMENGPRTLAIRMVARAASAVFAFASSSLEGRSREKTT